MKKVTKMVSALAITSLLCLSTIGCSSSFNRSIKNVQSNFGGGLNRVVKVYDQNGKIIAKYQGKIDIQKPKDGVNEVLFSLNGKRHIVFGGTVIVDEK